jgi:hypothetical protein
MLAVSPWPKRMDYQALLPEQLDNLWEAPRWSHCTYKTIHNLSIMHKIIPSGLQPITPTYHQNQLPLQPTDSSCLALNLPLWYYYFEHLTFAFALTPILINCHSVWNCHKAAIIEYFCLQCLYINKAKKGLLCFPTFFIDVSIFRIVDKCIYGLDGIDCAWGYAYKWFY